MQTLAGNLFRSILKIIHFQPFSSKKHEPYLYIDVNFERGNTFLNILPMYFTLNILAESFLTLKKSHF